MIIFVRRHWMALKIAGWVLFIQGLIFSLGDQWLTKNIQNEIQSFHGPDYLRLWIYGGLSFLLSLTMGLLQLLISLRALSTLSPPNLKNWVEYFKSKSEILLIEQIRSIGSCLQWGLLMILPGFIRYIFLLMVPLVVLFDPEYEKGNRDALQFSSQFVRLHFIKVLLLFFVFALLWPLCTTIFDEYKNFTTHPLIASIIVFIDLQMTLFFSHLLLKLWERHYDKVNI